MAGVTAAATEIAITELGYNAASHFAVATVSAASGATYDVTTQLLTTGKVDAKEVILSTALAFGTGYALSKGSEVVANKLNSKAKIHAKNEQVFNLENEQELHSDEFYNYIKLVDELDVSTEANTAVFYSGRGNRTMAEDFAVSNNKTTLEMTKGGKYLDDLNLFNNDKLLDGEATIIWRRLSQRYAENAQGNAYCFVRNSKPESIFNTTEYPALTNNKNVTNIFSEVFY